MLGIPTGPSSLITPLQTLWYSSESSQAAVLSYMYLLLSLASSYTQQATSAALPLFQTAGLSSCVIYHSPILPL